jgi:lauroyl/myristoyl acyltransferase
VSTSAGLREGLRGLREEVPFHAYRAVYRLSRFLPERAGRATFDLLGRAAYALLPGRRATVAANQAQVLGLTAQDPIVLASTREAFRLYARYWAETFRLPQLSDEEALARTPVTGYEHVERALEQGHGVICALPHLGNWDVGGRYMWARGHSVVSVAEDLRPQGLFELFLKHRQALGMEILGLSADGQVGRRLGRRLAENRVVALVAVRDLGGRGMEVEMFGRPRRLPTGPAFLSLTTGAPILVTPVYQTAGGWRIVFGAPLTIEPTGERRRDVATLTRLMGAEFERAISAAPADWHVFQPGWEP